MTFKAMLDERCISEAKLAKVCGVTAQTVYRWKKEGRFPAKYLDNLRVILGDDVMMYAASDRTESKLPGFDKVSYDEDGRLIWLD